MEWVRWVHISPLGGLDEVCFTLCDCFWWYQMELRFYYSGTAHISLNLPGLVLGIFLEKLYLLFSNLLGAENTTKKWYHFCLCGTPSTYTKKKVFFWLEGCVLAAKLSWRCCGINVIILDMDCHTETYQMGRTLLQESGVTLNSHLVDF